MKADAGFGTRALQEEMGTYTRFHEMGIERKSAIYREKWESRLAVMCVGCSMSHTSLSCLLL